LIRSARGCLRNLYLQFDPGRRRPSGR
jgi:hypothetical protein